MYPLDYQIGSLINKTFLAASLYAGLDLVIMNPLTRT